MRIEQKISIPLFIVGIGNAINGVLNKDTLFYYVFYVAVLVIPAIIFLFIKIKKSDMGISILLLFISLIALWLDDIRSLFGLMLLTYSIILSGGKKKVCYVYFSLAVFTVILRFALYSHSSTGFIVYLAGSAFVLIIFQHYIHPKLNKSNNSQELKKEHKPLEIKNSVVDILQLRMQGFDWPEINVKLELNILDSELPRKIREERKRLGFKNQDQFNFWLFKNGIITPISNDQNISIK
jgi:hypothetical protein